MFAPALQKLECMAGDKTPWPTRGADYRDLFTHSNGMR